MNTMKRFALFFALLFLLSGNGFAAEQTIKATEEMVGSGHATKTDTLNRALLVSHSSDGTHKAGLGDLLNGAANLKTFMNDGATAPEWAAGIKTGSFTRDLTAATADVAYTGVGFKPSLVIFASAIHALASGANIGFTTGASANYTISTYISTVMLWGAYSTAIHSIIDDGANNQKAVLKTFDSDGFTLTWTKVLSPTGTVTVNYIAFR